MRYLYLIILLAAIAAGGLVLELLFHAAGGSLSIFEKSGAGLPALYLLALVFTGVFVAVAAPGDLRHFVKAYAAERRTALRGFLAVFCLTVLVVICSYLFLAGIGQLRLREDLHERINVALARKVVFGILAGCILAATEELLFRGFVMRYLRWSSSNVVTLGAVIGSSLVFAVVHDIQDPLSWFTREQFPLFVGLTILGMMLATTYLASGSLGCAIGLHAGLIAAGEVLLRARIVRIDFEPWWMGGTDDIRMAPVVWALFAAIGLAFYGARRPLHRRFAVERTFVGVPAAVGKSGREAGARVRGSDAV